MDVVVLNQSVLPIEVLPSHPTVVVDRRARMKYCHLIARGASSIALQKLFDSVATNIEAYSDRLTELAVAFDRFSVDTVQSHRAWAKPVPLSDPAGFEDQKPLLDVAVALSDFGESVQTAIDENARRGEDVKAYFLVKLLRDIEEQLDVVETYLPR